MTGCGRWRAATGSASISRIASLHDGETVLDVPAKLSAQVRVFATGNGRKTDPVDAHSVALAALRAPGLVQVEVDEDLLVMGMLADRRDELGRARTQTINRLHRLLLELFPGGAKQFLSARQARALVATIKPRDIVGKTRRRLGVELIVELEAIDKKIKDVEEGTHRTWSQPAAPHCCDLPGIGPSGAARLLADVGDIHRFTEPGPVRVLERHRTPGRLLRQAGTPPALPRREPADQPGPAHHGHRPTAQPHRRPRLLQRKGAAGMPRCAMRRLKRRLSNVVCPHAARPETTQETGPGGQSGTTLHSSVTDLTPDIGSSEKPHPGPAAPQPKTIRRSLLT